MQTADCALRNETGYAEFGYFHCYLKMDAPRALVFRPLVKGNEALGTRLYNYTSQGWVLGRSSRSDPLKENGRLCVKTLLLQRSKVSLATRPEIQVTSTSGGRQSFAPFLP